MNKPTTTLETFNKRARSKFLQEPLIQALVGLGGPLTKEYTETLLCAQIIEQRGDKLTANYCGRRWCRVCNRIRTGKLINGYQAAIDQMPNQSFLTLTVPNVPAEELHGKMREMVRTMQKIQDQRRKNKRPGVNSIRKLECTYNATRNDYHPHFHIITSTREEAEYILDQWLSRYPTSDARGQDIRAASKPLELFKYFTKLTSKTTAWSSNQTGLTVEEQWAYPEALDVIFQAIKGMRIIQPTGKIKMVSDDVTGLEAQEIDETVPELRTRGEFYAWETHGWVSPFNGDRLSSYQPSTQVMEFRQKIRYLKPIPT